MSESKDKTDKKKKNTKQPSVFEEFVNLIGQFTKAISFLVLLLTGFGFLIFLSYTVSLDAFPTDVDFDESISLIASPLVFGLLYFGFLVFISAPGRIIADPLVFFGQHRRNNDQGENGSSNFIAQYWRSLKHRLASFSMNHIAFFLFALVGTWLIYIYAESMVKEELDRKLIAIVGVPLLCGMCWGYIAELINDLSEKKIKRKQRRRMTIGVIGFVVLILSLPIIFGFGTDRFLQQTMYYLNHRVHVADLHIEQPYTYLMLEYGYDGTESRFGDSYRKYKNYEVVLTGLGKSTYVRAIGTKTPTVPIPTTHIHIIERK